MSGTKLGSSTSISWLRLFFLVSIGGQLLVLITLIRYSPGLSCILIDLVGCRQLDGSVKCTHGGPHLFSIIEEIGILP